MVCFLAPVLAGFLDQLLGQSQLLPPPRPLPDEIYLFFTRRHLSPLPSSGCPLLPRVGCGARHRDPSRRHRSPHRPCPARIPLCYHRRAYAAIAAHPLPPGGGKLPKLPPRSRCWSPPTSWAGGVCGARAPPPLPTRSPAVYAAFVLVFFFFNTANVYHLPNRLDRFCFLSSGAAVKPPRLPRSRLPAPSRADLVFRAAPRRISVCKTKCFDGGRLQECLEAVWSFMGCAARSVLARSPRGAAGALDGLCRFFPAERRLPGRAALAGRRERGNYVRTSLFFAPELKNRDF